MGRIEKKNFSPNSFVLLRSPPWGRTEENQSGGERMRTYLPLLAADEERVTVVGGPSDPVGRHKKRKEKGDVGRGDVNAYSSSAALFSCTREPPANLCASTVGA